MIWNEELLKDIQRCEDKIFVAKSKGDVKALIDAYSDMKQAQETYIKKTKPVTKSAELNHIGRCTYSKSGELIGFYLEPIYKAR